MTYIVTCDWCGKRVDHDADYAKFDIHVERKSVAGELDRKWANEVKPTRFFCVTSPSREEKNRMGLPLDSFETSADCYERAIAAITGIATDRPDAGLEWRLVEVNADRDQHNRKDVLVRRASAKAEAYRQTIEEHKQANKEHAGRDGVGLLMLHPSTTSALYGRTITELEAMSDDELLGLNQVGAGRLREIRQALERYRGTAPSPRSSKRAR